MHHTDIPFRWSKEQLFEALLFTPPEEPLTPQEQTFLDGHGGDGHDRDGHNRDGGLERARWELLQFSRQNGAALDAARGALLRAHIRQEAQRITGEMARLQALAEYAVRTDIPRDETDYLSMSPAEFHACERRLRARARGLNS